MVNEIDELTEMYNKNFEPLVERCSSPEQQAAQFKIVSILQNVNTNETINSIMKTSK